MTNASEITIRTETTNAHTMVMTPGVIYVPAQTKDVEQFIDSLHKAQEEINPDCFVNFSWNTERGTSFICGQPLNMRRDEDLVENGAMTWNEYQEKWYDRLAELEMAEPSAEEAWYISVVR